MFRNINKLTAVFFLLFALLITTAIAKDIDSLTEVKISTSAHDWIGKNTIESSLKMEKGVQDADLDLNSKIVTVKFNSFETAPDAIISTIKNQGFDASLVKDTDSINKVNSTFKKTEDNVKL